MGKKLVGHEEAVKVKVQILFTQSNSKKSKKLENTKP